MVLAAVIVFFARFSKDKKPEEGKKLTAGQKTNNFVRNNAGKLAVIAMAPVIVEEAMASIKASKWVNANMAKDLAKKVTKTNIFGFVSYLTLPVILGIAAYNYVKINNKNATQKEFLTRQNKTQQDYSINAFISKIAFSSPVNMAREIIE